MYVYRKVLFICVYGYRVIVPSTKYLNIYDSEKVYNIIIIIRVYYQANNNKI